MTTSSGVATANAAATSDSPCKRCGACCASFRVSFYWRDANATHLPEALFQQLTPHLACMAGTNGAEPRCDALEGQVGATVRCRAYDQRPSPCREVTIGDEKCLRARQRYGLGAL
jgi:uncharacterized protein